MLKKNVIIFASIFCMFLSTASVSAQAASKLCDDSQLSKGILEVNYNSEKDSDAKIMIEKEGKRYFYSLQGNKKFPLELGNGEYDISILEKVNQSYVITETEKVDLKLNDKNSVYLNSIQNVNWNANMSLVKKAKELTSNSGTDEEKVKAIYNYVVENIKYDDNKINNIDSNYIPNAEDTFKSSQGICYDYSSLFAAMLRSVNVPTKLTKGYKTDIEAYHAWNQVYLNNKWVTIDTTYDSILKSKNASYSMIKDRSEYTVSKEY